MQRVNVIVKGEVQRAGYRDVVEKIARRLNIVGYVENLKPYDVRIVAEGEEKWIKDFIERIKIRDDPLINVEDAVVTYEKPTGEFKYFEIRRGPYEEENAERLDLAAYHLKDLAKNVKTMDVNLGEKIDRVGEKVDNVGDKVDALREETRQDFTRMDIKYDKISNKLDKIDKTLENLTAAILKLAEKK